MNRCLSLALAVLLAAAAPLGGCSESRDPAGTIATDTIAPTPPANLLLTPVDSNRIDLTWSPSTDNVGVSGYEISRDDEVVHTTPVAAWSDTALARGTRHCYSIRALDKEGNHSAPCETVCASTTDGGPIAATLLVHKYSPCSKAEVRLGDARVTVTQQGLEIEGSPFLTGTDGTARFLVTDIAEFRIERTGFHDTTGTILPGEIRSALLRPVHHEDNASLLVVDETGQPLTGETIVFVIEDSASDFCYRITQDEPTCAFHIEGPAPYRIEVSGDPYNDGSIGPGEHLTVSSIPRPLHLCLPIGGTPNADWVIVNYQDLDPSEGAVRDYLGAAWAYDNHGGVDFGLHNFVQMDLGVPVIAAEQGTVLQIHDGDFDRNACGIGGPCDGASGNRITIEHAGGLRTLYSHLKRNSVQVTVGQSVSKGEPIAQVGSSGNSSGPHLHFAVLDDQGPHHDPFEEHLWDFEPPYAGSMLNVLEGDMTDFVPASVDIADRPPPVRSFDSSLPVDVPVVFWVQFAGSIPDTSALVHKLYEPSGRLHRSSPVPADLYRFAWWYWRYRAWNLGRTKGRWRAVLELNGVTVLDIPFDVI